LDSSFKSSLAETAHWTAAARSMETLREDALFADPWAAALAGKAGEAWLARSAGNAFGTLPMVIRTRYFDDFLKEGVWQQGLRQVVILAAGLDTRAYRLEWPTGTILFELDKPEVLAYKQGILDPAGAKPSCERIAVAADLSADWVDSMVENGFTASAPTIWLLEGILFYLPNEIIGTILEQLSSVSAARSRLGFDIINQFTLTSPLTRAWINMQAMQGAPWIGWMDDPPGYLGKNGWQAALCQPGAPQANFGRWTLPVIPLENPSLPHNWYVTAVKG